VQGINALTKVEDEKGVRVNWEASAAAIHWNVQPFINGRYCSSHSTQCIDNINPATEQPLCRVPVGSPEDIDEAVRAARKSFDDGRWATLPPVRRAEVLFRFADLIVQHKEELALLDALEMGKPIRAALNDVGILAPTLLRSWAGFADKLVGESAPLSSEILSLNAYEPRGVVGAIAPWNYPTVNAVIKFGPALAAGNVVVLKPSEFTASSALKLAELALEAGIPEGVLNVVPGLGSTVGQALALHPLVNLLSFTGSTVTGRKIMELSGRSNGKPVLLECGGKSPQVVFEDIDNLDAVADAIVENLLRNQGQVCVAHSRLIVHEQIKDKMLEKIVSRAKKCQPRNPLDESTIFGPLASAAQRERVKNYIEQGLNAGAHAVLKGTVQLMDGCYVSPTVFDRVESAMSIVREEIFGPVLCVQGFKTEAEAIALANDTEYGLAATAWTRDMARGRRVAYAIKAGSISICTSGEEGGDSGCILSYEPQKASGFGSELGLKSLQSYSTLKAISFRGA
jgi:acyl-CoA reductase-like NAD-dependent aldehyde dehydrogenase